MKHVITAALLALAPAAQAGDPLEPHQYLNDKELHELVNTDGVIRFIPVHSEIVTLPWEVVWGENPQDEILRIDVESAGLLPDFQAPFSAFLRSPI